jgi:hypothetical protein
MYASVRRLLIANNVTCCSMPILQDVRKVAEARVQTASTQPGFAIALLQVAGAHPKIAFDREWSFCMAPSQRCNASGASAWPVPTQVVAADVPVEIRQAAAVNFKNFVKFRWVRFTCVNLVCRAALAGHISLRLKLLMQAPTQTQHPAISDAEKVPHAVPAAHACTCESYQILRS